MPGEHVPRCLNALGGGQAAADHLLQSPLHAGIAVVAKLRGKPHHGGLTDAYQMSQFAGGHERRLVVIFQNISGNPLLPLGKAGHIAFDRM